MDPETRRAAAIIAASFQASSPDEAVSIAEHYATWIEHGVLGEEPRTELEHTTTGGDLDEEGLDSVRARNQAAREQRQREKEAAKHAVRGEP